MFDLRGQNVACRKAVRVGKTWLIYRPGRCHCVAQGNQTGKDWLEAMTSQCGTNSDVKYPRLTQP